MAAAAAEKETDKVNYTDIIQDVMENKDLDPNTIDKSLEIQGNLKGFARFKCSCGHKWPSAHATATINLRTQTVVKLWKQGCNICEEFSMPVFLNVQFEEMVEYAIERYKRLKKKKDRKERKERKKRRGDGEDDDTDDDSDDSDDDDDDDDDGRVKIEEKQTAPHDSGRCERCQSGKPCVRK